MTMGAMREAMAWSGDAQCAGAHHLAISSDRLLFSLVKVSMVSCMEVAVLKQLQLRLDFLKLSETF